MLAGTTWGAGEKTLRTSALALCYSVAEYCAPVYRNSAHTNLVDVQLNNNNNSNNNTNITSIALKSSGVQAQKRNKTKSLIIFKSRGHTGVRGRRLFKVEKQF